jgi:tRNA(His) guanylyltransferase
LPFPIAETYWISLLLLPKDTHINNLYNTCLWNLVKPPASVKPQFSAGMTTPEAHKFLQQNAADSAKKNEMLFTRLGINYNKEDAAFRKGTTLFYREQTEQTEPMEPLERTEVSGTLAGETAESSSDAPDRPPKTKKRKAKRELVDEAIDVIGDEFWNENPEILAR